MDDNPNSFTCLINGSTYGVGKAAAFLLAIIMLVISFSGCLSDPLAGTEEGKYDPRELTSNEKDLVVSIAT